MIVTEMARIDLDVSTTPMVATDTTEIDWDG
jgi:hypothetical protein